MEPEYTELSSGGFFFFWYMRTLDIDVLEGHGKAQRYD